MCFGAVMAQLGGHISLSGRAGVPCDSHATLKFVPERLQDCDICPHAPGSRRPGLMSGSQHWP